MTNKNWLLLALAVLLGGGSLYLNRDWFAREPIQIFHRSRPARTLPGRHGPAEETINPVVFGFNRHLRLTSLKVVAADDVRTNAFPHLFWFLVSETNSVPVKDFTYGAHIPGMHPKVKGASPEPLTPGVNYRLLVEAGSLKAEHDFVPDPKAP